jgi:hypothetical protein
MNLIRTVRATVWGDGKATSMAFDLRDLPDFDARHPPEDVKSLDDDVQATVKGFWVTLMWKKPPEKNEDETVALRLHFPQGWPDGGLF